MPTVTRILNPVLLDSGTVTNWNVAPPSLVVGTIAGEAVDVMLKSEKTPVVGPFAFETAMLQLIG